MYNKSQFYQTEQWIILQPPVKPNNLLLENLTDQTVFKNTTLIHAFIYKKLTRLKPDATILSFFSFQSRDLYILNIGTKNKSWWLEHGIGCRITNTSWQDDASVESSRPIPPEDVVEGCLLDYYYVECIHAGVQCLLAVCIVISPPPICLRYLVAPSPQKM